MDGIKAEVPSPLPQRLPNNQNVGNMPPPQPIQQSGNNSSPGNNDAKKNQPGNQRNKGRGGNRFGGRMDRRNRGGNNRSGQSPNPGQNQNQNQGQHQQNQFRNNVKPEVRIHSNSKWPSFFTLASTWYQYVAVDAGELIPREDSMDGPLATL